MLRYSLATLLLLVPVAALGCAALVYASELVRDVTVTAVVLLLGLAALMALCGRGRRRAAAAGLAFAGGAYLLLVSTDVVDVKQYLLTGRVNNWLYATLYPSQQLTTQERNLNLDLLFNGDQGESAVTSVLVQPDPANPNNAIYRWIVTPRVGTVTFHTIAGALWALVVGLLGAVAAAVIHARGRRTASPANEET